VVDCSPHLPSATRRWPVSVARNHEGRAVTTRGRVEVERCPAPTSDAYRRNLQPLRLAKRGEGWDKGSELKRPLALTLSPRGRGARGPDFRWATA
jgi:hypothetical protein